MNESITSSSQEPAREGREVRLNPPQEAGPGLFQMQAENPTLDLPESLQEQVAPPEAGGDNFFAQPTSARREGKQEGQSDDLKAYAEAISKEPELPHLVERLAAIEGLTPEAWQQQLLLEKLDVLLEVHKEVAQAYGFRPADVRFGQLAEGEAARHVIHWIPFLGPRDRIIFSETALAKMNSAEVLRTTLEDSRHVYQAHAIRHPESIPADHRQQEIAAWKENFRHYTYFWDDPVGYESQPLERDAQAFALLVARQVHIRQQQDR